MIFATVFLYAGQKTHELVHPERPWTDMLELWERRPELSPWGGMRTLAHLRSLGEEVCAYFGAQALITKARSRAAGRFLATDADVWLTCDDDVEASADVVRRLVTRARETCGVVSAPCVCRGIRDACQVNLGIDPQMPARARELGEDLVPLVRTGFGLVALHRQAVLDVAATVPLVTDAKGGDYPALFLEEVRGAEWIGEDFAFSDRAVAVGVPIHALTEAPTMHAKVRGMLRRDLSVCIGEESARHFPPETLRP